MEKLSPRKTRILETLDEEIQELEEKLEKVQPLINELAKLRQTRRVLLDEKSTTGGGGNGRTQLSQEQVIHFMREADEPVQPQQIADALGVPGATVRSHLNRGKGVRYELDEDGWSLIGEEE